LSITFLYICGADLIPNGYRDHLYRSIGVLNVDKNEDFSPSLICRNLDLIVSLHVLIDTNFDAPDVHFDYLSLFSGTQAEKVGNPEKKL
jgi:hypothetical protein